jgi:hypothetical protein
MNNPLTFPAFEVVLVLTHFLRFVDRLRLGFIRAVRVDVRPVDVVRPGEGPAGVAAAQRRVVCLDLNEGLSLRVT